MRVPANLPQVSNVEPHTRLLPFQAHRLLHHHFRFIDSCITQLKAQGPSRTCDESEEEMSSAIAKLVQASGSRVWD